MGIGDHQLHAAQATTGEFAKKFSPECLGFRRSDVHAKDLPPAVVVNTNRDGDGDGYDPARLSDLYISGIQPDIGPVAFQWPGQESLNLVIDLAAQTRHLALRD